MTIAGRQAGESLSRRWKLKAGASVKINSALEKVREKEKERERKKKKKQAGSEREKGKKKQVLVRPPVELLSQPCCREPRPIT